MKKSILLLINFLPLLAAADTIHVEKASLIGPYPLQPPYMQADKTLKGDAFRTADYLKENASLVLRTETDGETLRGDALAALDSLPTLRVLRFHVRTDRFAKTSVSIKNLRNFKLYVDGQEQAVNAELRLPPGDRQIDLLCLTEKTDADTFDVALTGESLAGLEVNPADKRLYLQGDMLFGPHYAYAGISPGGKYFSYSIYNTKRDGASTYESYLKETATQKVVQHDAAYAAFRWLPRRDVLWAVREKDGKRALVLTDPATKAESLLCENIPEGDFTIAPTEDYLIYTRNEQGPAEVNGTKRIIDPDDRMPGWRNRTALYKFDLRTGQMRRLTFGSQSVYLSDISADGRKLLLTTSTMKPARTPFSRTSVLLMDAESGKVDTLLADTAFLADCSFSPDGRQLLVKASPGAFGGIGLEVKAGQVPNGFDYRYYLHDLSTGSTTPLLPGFKPSVSRAVWAEGDGHIYFSADDGCDVSLFRLRPDTRAVEKLPLEVSCLQDFGIARLQAKPTLVYTGQTGQRARDMYLATLDKKVRSRRIGEISFDSLTADVLLPTCTDWTFRASRGDTVHGFYFLPAHFDASKKYPMIVYYYGGCTPTPKTLESYYPHAAFANMGYVVYVVEPSGAIGYGQEFAARHVNTWGDESSDDIIEGVRAFCAAHPYIDSTRIGCIGASYGGFMTQYLQTKTDLFACAISHAGISDITAYWGGGYWGYTYGETAEYGSFPWNNPDLFVRHSPLYNADKIHTPLLLLHGTVDTNVPTNQSQAMYTALRILDRPVAYVTIADQDHHVLDWKKRMAWQEIIYAWFAMWLKDEPLWWNTLYPGDCFDKTQK